METQAFDRMRLYASLMQIKHAPSKKEADKIASLIGLYTPQGLPAAKSDPEFFGHLVAWNHIKSEVRDSQVALPVIALRGCGPMDRDLAENAVAHMMSLGPRELARAYRFNSALSQRGHGHIIPSGYRRMLERALNQYIQVREDKPSWWDKAVVSNRHAMLYLYKVAHHKPSDRAQAILFDKNYPKGSVFEAIASLKDMPAQEAAGTILHFTFPMPVAVGAVSSIKDEILLLALMEQMSGAELLNNTAMLKKHGVFDNPTLRAAYDQALVRAKTDGRVSTLKASRAAQAVGGKEADKVIQVQRARTDQMAKIEGDWLVAGDRSGSMSLSIVVARRIAALIAQRVKGKVYLVFFNTVPTFFDVTGMELDQIEGETQRITATGRTSIGCAPDYIMERGYLVNGIAIVSDGGENQPPYFWPTYRRYTERMGIQPSVTLFHVPGDPNRLATSATSSNDLQVYELGHDVDYYSLPNIVQSLKPGRWGLLTEIMETPLLTFSQVFAEEA